MLLGSVFSYFLPCLALIMEKFILTNFHCSAHVGPCENTTGHVLKALGRVWLAGWAFPWMCLWLSGALCSSCGLLSSHVCLLGLALCFCVSVTYFFIACGFLLFHIYNLIWFPSFSTLPFYPFPSCFSSPISFLLFTFFTFLFGVLFYSY